MNALEKIKNIYILRYDSAIAKVALLEKEFIFVKKQQDEILLYYNEYCESLKKKSSQGVDVNTFKNQHQFIQQFSPVIGQQKNLIEQLEIKIAQEKLNLIKAYKDLKALEYVLDKKKTVLKNLQSKQEAVQLEEEFLTIHLNKHT